jgi:thiol:disulfide interchange protein
LGPSVALGFADPFSVTARVHRVEGETRLTVSFAFPEAHYLYANKLLIRAVGGAALRPVQMPDPKTKHDPFEEKEVGVFEHPFDVVYTVQGDPVSLQAVEVEYQGCNERTCFLPVTRTLSLAGAAVPAAGAGVGGAQTWAQELAGFRIAGSEGGYLNKTRFLEFLDSASGHSPKGDWLSTLLVRRGVWLWLAGLLIVGLGAGLNLTPCVLPMIPVNVAIIGAGAAAGSRARGAALGGAYGGAMALVYGFLGLVVVMTGAKFGALNSTWWFNALVAVVFGVLALAMFDVFAIDLSRFQSGSAGRPRLAGVWVALFMGAVAALLAGACVAPVVISVLVFSTALYAQGNGVGLLFPFLLGVGMGLPWLFLGAGLSFLPKPGRWMERVKIVFGVLIVGMAAYYAYTAYDLWASKRPSARAAVEAAVRQSHEAGWLTSLPEALALARQTNQPVFIDFWASWCKNCLAMEKTTFQDADVRGRLVPFVRVKVQAEDPSDPRTRGLLDAVGAVGLPTYVVLVPEPAGSGR